MQLAAEKNYSFADFEIDAEKRLLKKDGEALALSPKAFDLLLVLVRKRGEILSKDELFDAVWKDQFVEENNLTVHIAALRKILGEKRNEHRFIVTVPGKGYSFVADLDDLPEREIVIENRSFSRIVVEEEIEETPFSSNGSKISAENILPASKFSTAKKYRIVIAGAIFIALALGGFYLWQRQSRFSSAALFTNSSVRQLTANGKVSIAALSPDGKLFAYVTNDFGQRSLWLGYVEGGNHLLLREAADAGYNKLAFSHDGKELYFSLRDDKNPKSALFKMPVFGGAPQKISDEISNFAVSPDGKQIAFARGVEEGDSLFVMNFDGSEKRAVASFAKTNSFVFSSVSWSPDGKRLALGTVADGASNRQELKIIEVDGGAINTVSLADWREIGNTAWLADGSALLVTAVAGASWSSVPQSRIFHVEPGGETREITTDRSSYGTSLSLSASSDAMLTIEHRQLNNVWLAPAENLSLARQITFSSFGKYDGLWGMDFTPDGRLIYTNSDTESQFISMMNADGGGQKPLTAPGLVDSVLTVSGDGRYVVFHSNRAGGFDIWRMDTDGANPKQLTFGGKGFQPFISADSRWVYYKSWLHDVGELRRVSIDGGEPEILTDRETSWGSFSPDGKHFAALHTTDKPRLAIFSAETNSVVKQFDLPKGATLHMGSHWTPDGAAVVYRDNNYGYWKQPIDGGEPQRLEGLAKEKFYNFAFSKDGKWFAFVRGQEIRDVVLFNNK